MPTKYMTTALLPLLYPSHPVPGCRHPGCTENAAVVTIREAYSARGPFLLAADLRTGLCDEHKADLPAGTLVLETYDDLEAMHRSHIANIERERQAIAIEIRRHEAAEMKRNGRVLRLSGHKGQIYETATGGLVCVMKDGRQFDACCWNSATITIDARASRFASSDHSDNCRAVRAA
jgi:hypothetical protein